MFLILLLLLSFIGCDKINDTKIRLKVNQELFNQNLNALGASHNLLANRLVIVANSLERTQRILKNNDKHFKDSETIGETFNELNRKEKLRNQILGAKRKIEKKSEDKESKEK